MLKKFKSLFIIEEEEEQNQLDASSATGAADEVEEADSHFVRRDIESGEVSEKFLKVLLRAIEKSNQEGFDYFEFKEFIRALDSVDMAESMKFKTAFANAKTMGATLGNLNDSAKFYLEVLGDEKGKFEDAVQRRRSDILDRRKMELKTMQESIEEKKAQIQKLQEDIAKLETSVDKKKAQIDQAEDKVSKTHGDFMQTYQHLVEQIQDDIQKINTYLA